MSPTRTQRHPARRIVLFTFDQGQSLDVTGPLEVFATANRVWARNHPKRSLPYSTEIVAAKAGAVTMSSGIRFLADRTCAEVRGRVDTLVVAGREVESLLGDRSLLQWLRRTAPRCRRVASVCSGSFLLAEAGLLDGCRATTHWAAMRPFIARYPAIEVEEDAIFVRAGRMYTSAGVTAGIDLALALVEEDLGHTVAVTVARHLVVFLKRPGGQSQFSSHLAAQQRAPGPLRDLPEWIATHLTEDLGVESLAARAAMSPRNFARVFYRELRTTPAKFVERCRLEAARRGLEDAGASLEEVAAQVGFSSAEQMRRTFLRHLRVLPHDYRRRFHARAAA